jgi:hypothetical protein
MGVDEIRGYLGDDGEEEAGASPRPRVTSDAETRR